VPNWIFVRVETDEGITGLGEATTEYHEQAVTAMIEQHFAPLLVGQDPTRIHNAWQQMQRFYWWRAGVAACSAASGIEQALWDITGKGPMGSRSTSCWAARCGIVCGCTLAWTWGCTPMPRRFGRLSLLDFQQAASSPG
tara:strand:+ start:1646 stop:2062 length:417 start_codon:yes stop_codon:yes gene_type:complete